MARHTDLTGVEAVHQACFIQNTDPALVSDNRVLANELWLDLTNSKPIMRYRNAGNTAWLSAEYHSFCVPVSDETTAITTGTKCTFRIDAAFRISELRATVTVASSSGLPTINIKKNGTTIFTTKLTIDATEETSKTAAAAYALTVSPTDFAEDDKIVIDVDVAGTGASGLKIWFIGVRI